MALMFLQSVQAEAVPALPGLRTITQKDGTQITVRIYGDERFHYTTTADNYLISQKDGIYYYATADASGIKVSDVRVSADASCNSAYEDDFLFFRSKGVSSVFENAARQSYAQKRMVTRAGLDVGFPTLGKIRSLVILVNFKDLSFGSETANDDFHRLLNAEGYSENGATGSARDYYLDNSNGLFDPTFDVVGPVTLSKDYAYYGANNEYGVDANPEEMIAEACRLVSESGEVNFADYDYNNDGVVDNVFVFYAGPNEAEGAGDDRIWPHRSELSEDLLIDGKKVSVYACTSEINMAGFSPTMAGIGTFCHEFGHVLGWADLYDTDGDMEGLSEGVWDWSLMCTGSYNNEGRTPPAVNSNERYMAKWIDPEVIEYTGDYELASLEESHKAYMIKTDMEGEYFMLENRQKGGVWDNYIKGEGLLIFHVDRSDRYVKSMTAKDRWDLNCPNNVKDHECYRIITARPKSGDGYQAYMPFPGASGNTSFTSESNPENISWSGAHIDAELTNITDNNGIISFRAKTSKAELIRVKDVSISGRDEVIVGDTVMFAAVIMPENASNKNVEWSSSDTTVLKISKDGVAETFAKGTATVSVVTEDGGFSDEVQVKVVEGQIFRAGIYSSSGLPVGSVEVHIKGSEQEMDAVSAVDGSVVFENLPAGKYTMTLKHPDYPSQERALDLKENASLCRITLLSEDEYATGVGKFNLKVLEYETSAFVYWRGSDAEKWSVSWYQDGKMIGQSSTDKPMFDITGLEPDKEYEVKVSETDDIVEGDFRKDKFHTMARSAGYPRIAVSPLYEKGEMVILKAVGIPEGKKTEWRVDGSTMKDITFKAENSEYVIELIIGDGKYNEKIIKYITVVEQ